ncbi:MAG: moderate conductance mechanosensitive channel [Clostridia bacterium]|nr:moderate conductance mechanosensitive channel [Clostridia bacterium]
MPLPLSERLKALNWNEFATLLPGLITVAVICLLIYLLIRLFKCFGQKEKESVNSGNKGWQLALRSCLLAAGRALIIMAVAGLGLFLTSYLLGFSLYPYLYPLGHRLALPGLKIAVIAFGAWTATRLLHGLIYYLGRFLPIEGGLDDESQKRLETLRSLLRNAVTVIVILVATIMSLKELGFDIAPLITAAGVGGLAISLGAQNLIRDYISGFFLLVENQLRVGDVVQINNISGVVEQLNLRTVVLRSLDGTVHIIPNGQINAVSNMTKSFSRYVIDVEVAYKENVDKVMDVLRDIGKEISEDPYFGPMIKEPLEVLGVDNFGSSGVVIKVMITTLPLKQWQVGRELRRRIKNRFDELGIEIPFPHVSLYWGAASQPWKVEVDIKENKKEGG